MDAGRSWAMSVSGTGDWTTGAAGRTTGTVTIVGRAASMTGRSTNAVCRAGQSTNGKCRRVTRFCSFRYTGELKDLALAASKIFKTAAVCTSLNDSDTFEVVVFNAGKQVDLVMTDPEQYSGPLKVLSDASRAAQWSKAFGKSLSVEGVTQAITRNSVISLLERRARRCRSTQAADRITVRFIR
jgi:hypothetical protein